MSRQSARIASGGRLVIPIAFRRALGMEEGVAVSMTLENGVLRVQTVPEGLRRAQALVAKYVPANVSLVDELIADRRAEAAAESD